MRWIREHKLISSLLAILMVLVIIFVASIVTDGGIDGITGTLNKGMSVVSEGLSTAARSVKGTFKGIFSFGSLETQIESLEEENDLLKRELAEAKLSKEELSELQDLSRLLNYEYTDKTFNVVTSNVTSMDGSNWTNVFTIDCGTESEIQVGNIVINGAGLVGKVTETGNGWSKVVSIIDEGEKVSFKVARDRKMLGVVSGNSQGNISGYMLDSESAVAEGDIIITSGIGTYPEGLEIGTISSVNYNSNTLLREITVIPSVDFRSLAKVAVII